VAWLPQWTAKPTQFAATGQTDHAQANRVEPLDDAAIVLPPSAAALGTQPRREPHNRPPTTIETTSAPRATIPWLVIAWPAGGFLSLVPLAIGLGQLAGLHRRSQIIGDHRWLKLLDELRRQLGVRRRVQLRQCESALAPLTWGALWPVLLVPFEADDWPDERRRLVLLHELAHVRRWDWLTQLVAHLACAVYWFNPLIWLAARQMRIERERACDDIVLASGARASDYARELLALAAGLSDSQMSTLVAVPMARRGALNDRLQGILDSRRSRAALNRAAVCLGAALTAAALAPLAMLQAAAPKSKDAETAEPKKEPPAAPTLDLRSFKRQGDDVGDDSGPPALGNSEVNEVCDVTLEEAIRIGLANSKTLRNLGGVLSMPVVPRSGLKHTAGQGVSGSVRDPKAIRGARVRFVLARTNDDVALADFEAGVSNMINDLERAYWDLYYNYRSLNAVQAGRDSALQTWRKVHALFVTGGKGGEAAKEAQAREQYFLFRAQVENTLGMLHTAESRLRYMMGLGSTDGRLIRPVDQPTTAEVRFDWTEVLSEALNHPVELPQDRELKLFHVLTNVLRDLGRNYQVSRTTFNRRAAAAKQVEAVQASYESDTATLDMLLDAQRRLADAEIAYYRALVDYNVAILQVHYRKYTLLEYDGILLTEGPRAGFGVPKK
jgi:beta-lactamase regulating signal transducer with metallopeptidase domain